LEKAQGSLRFKSTPTFAFLAEEPKSEKGCRTKGRRADGSGIGGSLAVTFALVLRFSKKAIAAVSLRREWHIPSIRGRSISYGFRGKADMTNL
jgi:hypothetical protein